MRKHFVRLLVCLFWWVIFGCTGHNSSNVHDECVMNAGPITTDQLARFPWLADIDASRKMTASSRIPKTEQIVRDTQMLSLIRGIASRESTEAQAGDVHIMARIRADDGRETFEFWTEVGGHSQYGDWVHDHPLPQETISITPRSWEFKTGMETKATGTFVSYALKPCTKG